MAEQPALNATFYAFRKREGALLLKATLFYAFIAIVSFAALVALNWSAFVDYMAWITAFGEAAETGGDVSAIMMPPASILALGPMLFLFMLLYYVVAAAYEAACLKWLVRGDSGGLFGFTLGADT